MTLSRSSDDEIRIRELIAGFGGDEAERRIRLGVLLESARHAHDANPAGWCLTVNLGRQYLNLNTGRIFAHRLFPEEVWLSLETGELAAEIRRDLGRRALQEEPDTFDSLPGVVYYKLRPEDFRYLWPALRAAHFGAVDRAAKAVGRTPYFTAHSPTLAGILGSMLEEEVPWPEYGEGTVTQTRVERIVELVRSRYQSWDGFAHPQFTADEIDDKQATVAKARELLARGDLERLLKDGDLETFVERIETIGKDNNLLFRSVPLQGDLSILYQPDLDKPRFCAAFLDLLHGEGDSPERLQRYLHFVREAGLPSKWTFPTYFLFFCHPESEIFVKPEVTTAIVRFLGRPETFRGEPTPAKYAFIRDLAVELSGALSAYEPRDLVDIQSLIWVCGRALQRRTMNDRRRKEFRRLYREFLDSYPAEPGYERHVALYSQGRAEAAEGYRSVLAAAERNDDVTDLVLLKFLPHADTEGNRARGAWIHVAPAVTKDVKGWFEGAGWTRPEDWPAVARALLGFYRTCLDDPGRLEEACRRLAENPLAKGFQSGMLSPLLNSLAPESFCIVNNKSRRLLNYLAQKKFSQKLSDYPKANETLLSLLDEIRPLLTDPESVPEILPVDLFDMFSHWLNAVKKFPFPDERYWKVAVEEEELEWAAWRDGGFIAIGYSELGDVSGLSRAEFNRRRDASLAEREDWTRERADRVWKLAHINEGDFVVANRGTTEVVGLGTVAGPYYFAPGQRLSHRLPVNWYDVRPRRVDQPGWRRALIELDRDTFERIDKASPVAEASSASGAFSPRAFELLAGLRETPSKDYYLPRKEEFQREVEEPFQRLFRLVVERLPPVITQAMETEKNVFSRILKNDWGRGGAWDFYWGALYRKGGKRIQDAQLFIWMNAERLDCGFFIGEYGSEQRRIFLGNLRDNRQSVDQMLESSLDQEGLFFGSRQDFTGPSSAQTGSAVKSGPSWREWVDSLGEDEIRAGLFFDRQKVVQLSAEDLAERIAEAFRQLFPLVLLAVEDDPLPAMSDYLDLVQPEVEPTANPDYPLEKFAAATGFEVEMLERWVQAIERKGQAILYGPPGTGKTFAAEHLARHLVGGGRGSMELVQLHPSYAYEDFIQGIRPALTEGGGLTYRLVKGRFRNFCQRAERLVDRSVLIIDEINRANLSRVFGELMYLLEYRNKEIPLAGGETLKIPDNVRLIGTMNTADRSIALVDHALRRRFAFLPLRPDYGVLRRYHEDRATGFPVERLIERLREVNVEIGDRHYELGITFFLREDLVDEIEDIWRMEVEPYLEEFFFDQPDKVNRLRWEEVGRGITA